MDNKIIQEMCHQYAALLGNLQSVSHVHCLTTWQTTEISTCEFSTCESCEFREGTLLPRREFPKGPLGPGLCLAHLGGGEGWGLFRSGKNGVHTARSSVIKLGHYSGELSRHINGRFQGQMHPERHLSESMSHRRKKLTRYIKIIDHRELFVAYLLYSSCILIKHIFL